MKLVYDFLSEQVWDRSINRGGYVHLMGDRIYISYKLKEQPVTVTFDPLEKQWLIRTENGSLLKTSTRSVPTQKEIKDFAIMSKNFRPKRTD